MSTSQRDDERDPQPAPKPSTSSAKSTSARQTKTKSRSKSRQKRPDLLTRIKESMWAKWILGIGGALALFATIVGNVETITNGLRDTGTGLENLFSDPTPTPTPSPTPVPTPTPYAESRARLDNVRVTSQYKTIGDVYRQTRTTPNEDYTESQLATPGFIVSYRIELTGMQNHTVNVRWTLYDQQTQQPFNDYDLITAWPHDNWTTTATVEVSTGEIWVPFVDDGTYAIYVALFEEAQQRDFAYAKFGGTGEEDIVIGIKGTRLYVPTPTSE